MHTQIDTILTCFGLVVQTSGLPQLNIMKDADQQQQLLGSPRIQQDELSGGLIIAPGSQSTASVSEPLEDIAGGKSGADAEIENPYDQKPTDWPGSSHQSGLQQQQQQAGSNMQDASSNLRAADYGAGGEGHRAEEGSSRNPGEEYSDQEQSKQASSGCKQS